MLFTYGVRVNADIVMDIRCRPIPIQVGMVGEKPQFEFRPWFYFPEIVPLGDHPIVRNLDLIKTDFVSTIDLIDIDDVRKTVLLTTSEYTRVKNAPVMVDLADAQVEPDQRLYNRGQRPIAVLLEGTFRSAWRNRLSPDFKATEAMGFRSESGDNKMIGFVRDVANDKPRPSSAYDITNVTLSEAFAPLIGVNMTMKNSFNMKAEYRKQRNMALNVTSAQLTEGHTNEFVIGAGYTVKNLNFIRKGKDGSEKKVSNDLKIQVDLSYKDVKMLLRKIPTSFYVEGSDNILDRGLTQASSGNKVFAIKISADYVLSQKINLQLFYDHQGTTPLISSSYPIRSDDFGLSIKLMLTR